MGSTIGKPNSDATNDLDANGNIVATGTGVKTVADPNRGLTDDQMKNTKFASSGIKSLGQAMSSMGGPVPSGGNSPTPATNFTFANNQPQYQPMIPPQPKPKNPFFG